MTIRLHRAGISCFGECLRLKMCLMEISNRVRAASTEKHASVFKDFLPTELKRFFPSVVERNIENTSRHKYQQQSLFRVEKLHFPKYVTCFLMAVLMIYHFLYFNADIGISFLHLLSFSVLHPHSHSWRRNVFYETNECFSYELTVSLKTVGTEWKF